jgi:hypothetical protein
MLMKDPTTGKAVSETAEVREARLGEAAAAEASRHRRHAAAEAIGSAAWGLQPLRIENVGTAAPAAPAEVPPVTEAAANLAVTAALSVGGAA